jgi:hypothetical protein
MAAFDLTTLANVRAFIQKRDGQVAQDAEINTLITAASRALLDEFEREWAPVTANAARQFAVELDPVTFVSRLPLAPYDLRTVVSIVADGKVLTEGDDYELGPLPADHAVFTWVEFYGLVSTRRSGRVPVTITGAWGFAAIPEDVVHWCNVTVATWLRRDVAAFSTVFNLDEQKVERPQLIPAAAYSGLKHYWRF